MSPMCGLSNLIQGCCYYIQKDTQKSIELLQRVIEEREKIAHNAFDAHVSAFAYYELGLLLLKDSEVIILNYF